MFHPWFVYDWKKDIYLHSLLVTVDLFFAVTFFSSLFQNPPNRVLKRNIVAFASKQRNENYHFRTLSLILHFKRNMKRKWQRLQFFLIILMLLCLVDLLLNLNNLKYCMSVLEIMKGRKIHPQSQLRICMHTWPIHSTQYMYIYLVTSIFYIFSYW